MNIWQVQEAKAKLTKLINEAKNAPQIISRRGEPEIVVISMSRYRELTNSKDDVVSFFRKSPLCGVDITIDRDRNSIRDVNL